MHPLIGKEYSQFLVNLIDSAKSSIEVCVYDWRFYPDQPEHPVSLFNQALIRAVRRGVRVRALINASEFLPNLTAIGIKACRPQGRRVLHSKFVIIDSRALVIGSHNLTSNAFTTNFETSVYIPDCEATPRFLEFFNNLYTL